MAEPKLVNQEEEAPASSCFFHKKLSPLKLFIVYINAILSFLKGKNVGQGV